MLIFVLQQINKLELVVVCTNVELTAAGKYSKQCNFFSTQVKQNTTNYIVVSFFLHLKRKKEYEVHGIMK